MTVNRSSAAAAALLLVVVLAGCTPAAAPSDPGPTASVAPEPTAAAPAFRAPQDCADLIGPDLQATFDSAGIQLFDSSNGEGIAPTGDLIADQSLDPYVCVYGIDSVDLSSFHLEAQPLGAAQYSSVRSALEGAGFTMTDRGDAVLFTAVGDDTGDQGSVAIIHELVPGGWVTARGATGGQERLDSLTAYVDAVVAHLSAG